MTSTVSLDLADVTQLDPELTEKILPLINVSGGR